MEMIGMLWKRTVDVREALLPRAASLKESSVAGIWTWKIRYYGAHFTQIAGSYYSSGNDPTLLNVFAVLPAAGISLLLSPRNGRLARRGSGRGRVDTGA